MKCAIVRLQKLIERPLIAVAALSLQATLWTLWTVAMVGFAYIHWQGDSAAHRPVNLIGMVIYLLLFGLGGLIVMTLIEIRLEPERFLD